MSAGAARRAVVAAPASSANLGAGFDVFGMAVTLTAEMGVGAPPPGALALDEHHPGRVPFERLGGAAGADLWLRTDIPMARGLGFSGAVRAAAAGLAVVDAGDDLDARAADVLAVAAELEGHGDNVAASVVGGVVAYVDGRALPFPVGPTLGAATFVAWVPSATTSTDRSRRTLDDTVDRADAVHNIARAAQFALAFAHDDPDLLSGATDDALHQGRRLPGVPGAADALAAGVGAGAWCGWLSGSGPTVGFLCAADAVGAVVDALDGIEVPGAGAHVKTLGIDPVGLRRVGG